MIAMSQLNRVITQHSCCGSHTATRSSRKPATPCRCPGSILCTAKESQDMIVACYGLCRGRGRLDYVPKNRSGQAAIVSGGARRVRSSGLFDRQQACSVLLNANKYSKRSAETTCAYATQPRCTEYSHRPFIALKPCAVSKRHRISIGSAICVAPCLAWDSSAARNRTALSRNTDILTVKDWSRRIFHVPSLHTEINMRP